MHAHTRAHTQLLKLLGWNVMRFHSKWIFLNFSCLKIAFYCIYYYLAHFGLFHF